MKDRAKWFEKVIVAMLALCVVSACGGGGSTDGGPDLDITSTSGAATVYGKVINISTREPITGATVKLIIKDNVFTATTAEDNAETADVSEAGDFEFAGVAAGNHKLRVEAEGYTVYENWLNVTGTGQGAYYYAAGTDGKIGLNRGCNIDVYVSAEGGLLSGVYVFACSGNSPEIGGVTDENGHVSLTGLSQAESYSVVAVANDQDGDGLYDYSTGSIYNYSCINSDLSMAISMPEAERNDTIAVIGGSYEKYNTSSRYNGLNGAGKNEPLTLVFNYPVSIGAEGVALTYRRDLVLSTDDLFEKVAGVASDTALSAGNTILTVTPAEPLIVNESYSVTGSISASVYGDTNYWGAATMWYVFDDAGISSDTIVRADNYNGHTGEAGFPGSVHLKFPEYVYGTATVKAYTANSEAAEIDPEVVVLRYGSITTDEKWSGCTDGECGGGSVFYRVNLLGSSLPQLEDNADGSVNNVTVYIDATDYEGNRLQKEYVLSVE